MARSAKKEKAAGLPVKEPAAHVLLSHQLGELPEHLRHLAPQLFIVPFQAVDLLRVHPVGVGMDGHLIEIVGTAPL